MKVYVVLKWDDSYYEGFTIVGIYYNKSKAEKYLNLSFYFVEEYDIIDFPVTNIS